MKTYLLLRSNKQTGPYSFDELLTLGLRAQDLLWVEGKSASWRYPSELDEFRAHVPVPVIEPMADSKAEPAPAEAGPVHHGAATLSEPTPEKETFHFHPRIRPATDPLALKESMHFHPRLNGGSVSLNQGEGDTHTFPTLSRFMQTSVGHPASDTQETIGVGGILPGMDTAAFYPAKPPADAEDEVPSLALQAAPEQVEQPKKSPVEVSPVPRIKVTLPAAVADKTMVIIHPREQHPASEVSAPGERLQESSRRPVLEFLDEPAPETTAAPAVEPALATLPVETADITEPTNDHHPVEAIPLIPGTALESPPVEETLMTVESTHVEIQPASAGADSGYSLPSVRPKDTAGILQKVAVAAAIISLVSVAALIANSVFNPNAYNYETKSSPTAPVRKLPVPQTGASTALPPATQDEPGKTVAGDSDQSIKSETANNPTDNQARPAVKKIE